MMPQSSGGWHVSDSGEKRKNREHGSLVFTISHWLLQALGQAYKPCANISCQLIMAAISGSLV